MLADDYFLMALNDQTGRHRVTARVLGLALAGGLLGELMLEQRITVHDGRPSVLDPAPPSSALAHRVLDQLHAERRNQPFLRTWLAFLSRTAVEDVADRLWRAGTVRREKVRRLWRAEIVYPPVDQLEAARPGALLATALQSGRQLTWDEALLAGLAMATGLDTHVLWTATDSRAHTYMQHIVDTLPAPVRELMSQLHAAAGDAVLTGRT